MLAHAALILGILLVLLASLYVCVCVCVSPQAGETQRLLAMAEGRLAHSDARVRESDNELMSLRR